MSRNVRIHLARPDVPEKKGNEKGFATQSFCGRGGYAWRNESSPFPKDWFVYPFAFDAKKANCKNCIKKYSKIMK